MDRLCKCKFAQNSLQVFCQLFYRSCTKSRNMFTNVKNVQQSHTNIFYLIKRIIKVIALWYCLCLPSCGCGFESEAHQLHYFQFVLLELLWGMDENKQKESGICPFFLKNTQTKITWAIYNFVERWRQSNEDLLELDPRGSDNADRDLQQVVPNQCDQIRQYIAFWATF